MLCCAQMRTWESVPDGLRAVGGSIVQSREEAHAAWVRAGDKLTESWLLGLAKVGICMVDHCLAWPALARPSSA
jgi:hypothetical protein